MAPTPFRTSEVPAAILRHNLYGVDIDLRAVQLAGLSLYIKGRSAEAALGIDETRINQVNLVVADAVLPQDGARRQFLAQYRDDKVVQDAVRQVLDEMANVAEVGSLLRVEERLRDILGKAGHAAAQDWDMRATEGATGPGARGPPALPGRGAGAVPEQWGAHYTVARLLEDLRAFAARALQPARPQRPALCPGSQQERAPAGCVPERVRRRGDESAVRDTTDTARNGYVESYPEASVTSTLHLVDRALRSSFTRDMSVPSHAGPSDSGYVRGF